MAAAKAPPACSPAPDIRVAAEKTMRLVLAMLLMASPVFAADNDAPLAPGKPAGVAQAEMNNHDLFIYISLGMIALAAGGMALSLSHSSATAAAPTTTTP